VVVELPALSFLLVGGMKSCRDRRLHLQIFVNANASGSGELNEEEFGIAFGNLREHIRERCARAMQLQQRPRVGVWNIYEGSNVCSALEQLGLSTATLVALVATASCFLLLLLIFVFLGIGALTTGSSFAACINSVLPLGAALGLGSGSDASSSDDAIQEAQTDPATSRFRRRTRMQCREGGLVGSPWQM
jgi:hypothetical protein